MKIAAGILIALGALVPIGTLVYLGVRGRPNAKEKVRTPGPPEPVHDLGTIQTHGPGPTDKEKSEKGKSR